MNYYWPVILIVVSNVFYNICTKSAPNMSPFASLTVTYTAAAVVSAAAFFITAPGTNILAEYKNINWSPFVLGLSAVGLETGFIYLYKAGWNISTGQLVCSSLLALCLIVVGYFLYHETITATKVIGILVCLLGLFLINR